MSILTHPLGGEASSLFNEGVSLFLLFCSLRTKLYLDTLKLYYTSIPANPYFKQN
ncbi:hypothetical protein HMPREF0973_02525 [Prevotella veroralis F0319]|uniref:Uncharacterized protein n=1 Tax=Prevotella veroralis F0319 TaxID=649761 RepID=C9MSA8_9BACT|nr:hypothetical protein HMPREF0973_02525 [Prevotella veroralis F0319]